MALEDKVNEILGLEPAKTPNQEEFKAPVPRTAEKDKTDIDNGNYNIVVENSL